MGINHTLKIVQGSSETEGQCSREQNGGSEGVKQNSSTSHPNLSARYNKQTSCFQLETIEEPEPPLSPLLPPTTPGGFVFKTEAELEEQILKEIDLNRKKIREKRAEKRRKQELEGIENLSPER